MLDNIDNIKVSIIIPVYNVEKYIDRCLKCAVNQTFKDIEIILVNDGSTDKSINIINKYLKKYSNITLINQQNQGLSSARNTGIKNANGKYIMFADSDDYFSKRFVETLYNTAEKEKSDIVVCNYKTVFENKKIKIKNKPLKIKTYNSEKALDILIKDVFINNFAWNKIYKKEIFTENNINFPIGKTYEDMYVSYRLFHKSKKVSVINKKLYCYVKHKKSITATFTEKNFNDIISGLFEMKKYLLKNNIYKKYAFSYNFLLLKNILFLIYRIIFSKDINFKTKTKLLYKLKNSR